jgi:hypothetical protein
MITLPAPAQIANVTDSIAELSPEEVARQIVAILGRPLVALVTGVSATRVVKAWEEGGNISDSRENALRVALQVAVIIKTRFKDGVVRNWVGGHNAALEDRAPGELILALTRVAPLSIDATDLARRLLAAARAFVTR